MARKTRTTIKAPESQIFSLRFQEAIKTIQQASRIVNAFETINGGFTSVAAASKPRAYNRRTNVEMKQTAPKSKGGRPKGSKNKSKTDSMTTGV